MHIFGQKRFVYQLISIIKLNVRYFDKVLKTTKMSDFFSCWKKSIFFFFKEFHGNQIWSYFFKFLEAFLKIKL